MVVFDTVVSVLFVDMGDVVKVWIIVMIDIFDGHCQVVLGSLRKAMSIRLGSHLSGVAFPQIERVGPSVAI